MAFLFGSNIPFSPFPKATEIQNIQIADGDVARDLAIPMHMIFPRLFTCPTLVTDNFKVGQFCRRDHRGN